MVNRIPTQVAVTIFTQAQSSDDEEIVKSCSWARTVSVIRFLCFFELWFLHSRFLQKNLCAISWLYNIIILLFI